MADEDKLDILPDVLLSIIVSSLPFKEAVRTSILSKRWVKIWQATKNIELHESFFVRREDSDQRTRDVKIRAFIDFATNFIRVYQESTVSKFSLSLSNPIVVGEGEGGGRGFVDECIRFAISHKVKTLELDFSDGENESNIMLDLPPIVYEHENLESLKLFSCGFRAVELKKLINLKNLCIGWIEVGIGEIRDLVKKCRKLESLNLKNCWNVTHFEIGGNDDQLRLRSLTIENCKFLHDWISIEAPKLTYFRYFGTVGSFRVEVNRCFEEADLGFEIDDDDDHSEISNLLYVLLESLYPARVLSVCSSLLQVIPLGDEPIRMQARMHTQHLRMRTKIHPNEFYGIIFLLNSCPYLKKLTLMLGQGKIFQDYEPPFRMDIRRFWATNMVLIKCLSASLETVEVKGFKGKQHEISFLTHLLHYGRILKTLSVAVDSHDIANIQIYIEKAQILNTIKPASKNIQIHIS
ncbi:F-box protein At3g62230-like [Benincasa hispida]|uniref:F-box protein At3g62230-like n=1 Tax=Benincasa hispida TaxID=102211 RepID=UPI0018FF7B01|nr:F-box protein At3g62230-like [Benincasa hispida]